MRVVTLGSGRSGTGKTFVAANLGVALARRGLRTCLVDLDLSSADLHLLVGVFRPVRGLLDLLRGGAATLEEVMLPVGNSGLLHLIPGAGETVRGLDSEEVNGLIEDIAALPVDIAIVDLTSGVAQHTLDLFATGNPAWVVASADPASVRDALRYLRLSRLRRTARGSVSLAPRQPKVYTSLDDLVHDMNAIRLADGGSARSFQPAVVLNRCGADLEPSADELMKLLEEEAGAAEQVPLVAQVPEDPSVERALASLIPVLEYSPGCAAARAIDELADKITGDALAETTDVSGKIHEPILG
ncbi:MAG: MinD/ParA family protein [Acidobacteriota bacterium]|nr:MAG: MinD/ParA family protein [Acidobacteriota bacterium]